MSDKYMAWLVQNGWTYRAFFARASQALPSGDSHMANKPSPLEKKTGHGGKVENDVNQTGHQAPTQKNEGQRTPNSRSDRESHVGGSNQLQSRRGGGGSGTAGH
jgi:hypothetical protein